MAGALEGLVLVDLIGVVTHEPAGVRARAIYFPAVPPRPDESEDAYIRRIAEANGATGDTWEHTPSGARRDGAG